MKLTIEKNDNNCFWLYARNEKDMAKVLAVTKLLQTYGYSISHVDNSEMFVMLSALDGQTQNEIKEDYSEAKKLSQQIKG